MRLVSVDAMMRYFARRSNVVIRKSQINDGPPKHKSEEGYFSLSTFRAKICQTGDA